MSNSIQILGAIPATATNGYKVAEKTISLRPGRLEDAPIAGTICYEAFKTISGQHNFPPDFPSPAVATKLLSALLSRPNIYSVVAELDGRVVGSNFLWETGPIAGVGPITVSPAVQNGQIGSISTYTAIPANRNWLMLFSREQLPLLNVTDG